MSTLLVLSMNPIQIHAISIFGTDANNAQESTQILNNLQLVAQYKKQVDQYINQVESYRAMLENIGELPQRQWEQFENTILRLKNVMRDSSKVTYIAEDLNEQFNKLYKGYEAYFSSALGANGLDTKEVYQEISEDTRQTISGSLKMLGISQGDLEDDVTTMRELEELSKTSVGQKSAIQAANEIALHQTTQLKKLHKTLLIQSQAQMKAIEAEQAKRDMQKAQWQKRHEEGYDIDNSDNRLISL